MTARHTARPLVSATVAFALGAPAAALGQEVGPYDPLGIRAGGFLIFPSLSVAEVYDDNVFAVSNNETDDFITLIQPRVRAESNFPRHSLGLSVGSDIAFYASETDENYQDFFVSGDGQLDITGQSNLSGELSFARTHENRDDPEDNPNDNLTTIFRYGSELSYFQAFNRLNFRLTGTAVRDNYDDSGEADRDQNTYTGTLRTGFFVSPRINTFLQGSYSIQDRDRKEDFAGIERNSQIWGVAGGAEVDFTDLLTGEFFVGYLRESFDEGDFNDEDGIGYGVDLIWLPTLLTTVTLSGGGNFQPTSQADAESNFESTAAVRVDHELLRNVVIGGRVGWARDDFKGSDRTDDRISAGADVSYLLNRNFSVDAGYVFSKGWSDLDEEEFTRNIFRVGVTARL